MILWSVLFTDEDVFVGKPREDVLVSCRVAAPTIDIAKMIVGSNIDVPIARNRKVVFVPAGEIRREASMVSVVRRYP